MSRCLVNVTATTEQGERLPDGEFDRLLGIIMDALDRSRDIKGADYAASLTNGEAEFDIEVDDSAQAVPHALLDAHALGYGSGDPELSEDIERAVAAHWD